MSQILEAFRRYDTAFVADQMSGADMFEAISTDFELSLQVYDRKICHMLAREFPSSPWLTYPDIASGIPEIIFQGDVLNSLIAWSHESHAPNRITSAGLQLGTQGVHHLHRLRWNRVQDRFVVSLVSRFPRTHTEGTKVEHEFTSLQTLYAAMKQQPEEIRAVIDVVEPIAYAQWEHDDELYPVLCTEFDPMRGELSTNILSALPGNQQPSIPGLVIHYAYPFTDRMLQASANQILLMDGFMGKETRMHWQVAEYMFKQQWKEIAFGLGVLAASTGFLPGNLQFNAGDLMGTILPAQESADNMPHIQQLKLVSIKGGLLKTGGIESVCKTLRTYSIQGLHPVSGTYTYGIFEMLSDSELREAVEMAGEFVKMNTH